MEYSSQQILQHNQINYRQLDYWIRSGLIAAPAEGSGNPRKFDTFQATKFGAVSQLMHIGMRLDIIRTLSASIDEAIRERRADFTVALGQASIRLQLTDLLPPVDVERPHLMAVN